MPPIPDIPDPSATVPPWRPYDVSMLDGLSIAPTPAGAPPRHDGEESPATRTAETPAPPWGLLVAVVGGVALLTFLAVLAVGGLLSAGAVAWLVVA
jgi:hypothetical protein